MCVTEDFFGDINPLNYHTNFGIPKAKALLRDVLHKKIIISEITGGEITRIQDVPYQAGLIIHLSELITSVCGGSLISSTRVLTAAHCYDDGVKVTISYTVVLGTMNLFKGGRRIDTDQVTVHPMWNPTISENDLAILHIPKIKFSGLKITSDQYLSSVSLTIISNEECAAVYPEIIQDSHVCTIGNNTASTCHGDSGGPLAVKIHGKSILVGGKSTSWYLYVTSE
ncbi:unnamed protein product [Danaus chrysippus]|uniref:(African queen) hypothetical protein n=1 Tax=Danaus chrysippus TaxID=151541 RepID=A0A8J2R9U8_9NEOP|nr:unnamed protein product [Danaus chrysippus]